MSVLFLDLQKAFDTVSHDILLKKLYHYGMHGNAYRLLASYLTGRKQFIKIGNFMSFLAFILWGVSSMYQQYRYHYDVIVKQTKTSGFRFPVELEIELEIFFFEKLFF